MKNRLAIFSKYSEGISVSIHQNQFTDSRYSGAQMFYSKDNAEGEKLAGVMQKQFVSLLQPDNTRETKPVGDELYLLNNTQNPAANIPADPGMPSPAPKRSCHSTGFRPP